MNILSVRDENGKFVSIPAIKGEDGKDYVLTDADKREIADMISAEAGITIVPTKVSDLENDAGYITSDALQGYAQKTELPTVPTNISAFANDRDYVTMSDLVAYEYLREDDLRGKVSTLLKDGDFRAENDIASAFTMQSEDVLYYGFAKEYTDDSLVDYAKKTDVSAFQTEAQVQALIQSALDSASIAYVGSGTPASDLGKDGDIYIDMG